MAIFGAIYVLIGSQHLKSTLHLASGSISVGGGHGAKRKWDFLVGLVAWQRVVVGKILTSFRQFMSIHQKCFSLFLKQC